MKARKGLHQANSNRFTVRDDSKSFGSRTFEKSAGGGGKTPPKIAERTKSFHSRLKVTHSKK